MSLPDSPVSLPDLFGQSSNNAFIKTFRLRFMPLVHPDKPGDDSFTDKMGTVEDET
jgi:hypothetical protein